MERRARRFVRRGGRTALFHLMEKHGRDHLTASIWERALHANDPVAERLIRRATRMLGAGIASVVNLLDLELVILGGGLGERLGPLVLSHMEQEMKHHLFLPDRAPHLRLSSLGDLSGAIGAALLAVPTAHVSPFSHRPANGHALM
jgi:glucokinase